jgi:hypothetical protein
MRHRNGCQFMVLWLGTRLYADITITQHLGVRRRDASIPVKDPLKNSRSRWVNVM